MVARRFLAAARVWVFVVVFCSLFGVGGCLLFSLWVGFLLVAARSVFVVSFVGLQIWLL